MPADAGTVQGRVDAAASGATVCVDGGTWTEQVVIDKDLTLRGLDGVTIAGPDDFTIPESAGSTWEPIVFTHGGTVSGAWSRLRSV